MKLKKRILVVVVSLMLAPVLVFAVLGIYMRAHPGPLPAWVVFAAVSFLIAITVAVFVNFLSAVRKDVAIETTAERSQRQAIAAKGFKAAIVLFSLIFLNGIRLVIQHAVPWQYAIVRLTVNASAVVAFWISLRRLKKSQIDKPVALPRYQ